MEKKLNGAAGDWYKLEQQWKRTLQAGGRGQVNIKPIYKGDSKRPDGFHIQQIINNKPLPKIELKIPLMGNKNVYR
ncbi:DNA/RNA non-specific endonuclease [Neisseria wadsworthii]|uniref:DNA/RNA non-specific endonuclease n=1 Tax=Neisseria wadsworthii TaxID=607711 RepID=UPI00190065C2|nr:DNA/RNA non-specific endonuclease [Neisseria wadsworthii]